MLSQPSHTLFSRITQALKHRRFPSHTPPWTTNGKPFCQAVKTWERSAWTWGEQCANRGRAWYVEATGGHCCGAKQMETLGFSSLGILLLGHL
ncbi:hypothetical protein ES332_A02G090800v1 [Gossypium tomentosum]|uniref:Uncharacterized protein n=1 Tax=Gossypium tomentosum TaxID=34277 RepID=A0A5D2REV0_GOSTO|nr:hypothetical protein ES332_A02G090800v1 [Gossypium tomentosum]